VQLHSLFFYKLEVFPTFNSILFVISVCFANFRVAEMRRPFHLDEVDEVIDCIVEYDNDYVDEDLSRSDLQNVLTGLEMASGLVRRARLAVENVFHGVQSIYDKGMCILL
jgi:hypothetical protein